MRPEAALAGAGVALGRALRARGVGCGADDALLFVRALGEIDVARREHVYWAARASFVRRREDVATFDEVFARLWAGLPLDVVAPAAAEHGEGDPRMPSAQLGADGLSGFRRDGRAVHLLDGGRRADPVDVPSDAAPSPAGGDRRGVLAAYSAQEALGERAELAYDAHELRAVRRLADELRARAPRRVTRRRHGTGRGERLDLRRTLGRALRTDGEILRPAYAGRVAKPRRILFLCDVSGSMERCSRPLFASLHAVVTAAPCAEAFVFATRLTRVTAALRGRDARRALEGARREVGDWSGGTRIGATLADFNRRYAPLGLARGAIAVVVSDGWDRGDTDLLVRELERLRLQARRLVWLNPQRAAADRQPLAVGMRAALPLVDDYVAGHDDAAIARLVAVVAADGRARQRRRQGRREL